MKHSPIWIVLLCSMVIAVSACSQLGGANVPPSGDTSTDASAAQQFVPDLQGYYSTNANSIVDALTTFGGGASLVSGNPAAALLIAQIDGMIACYQNTGAVAAKVYVEQNFAQVLQGQIPSMGVLAVINQDRVVNNFLQCALGSSQGLSAQNAQVQPCGGSGTFMSGNETLHYLYASTDNNMCATFQSFFPVGR